MGDLPVSTEYSIGKAPNGKPCIVIKSQKVNWEGLPAGPVTETFHTIEEIEQLVGFSLRCGNNDLMKAVRRPLYAHLYGPDHPHATA
jgi:hypothetical protein